MKFLRIKDYSQHRLETDEPTYVGLHPAYITAVWQNEHDMYTTISIVQSSDYRQFKVKTPVEELLQEIETCK